ncbi:MAG: hypothetical protein QGI73_02150, partial [Candidatus Thalassarchaeaceae archaeon]|nr:hypothetical protein [Candidatus Thalassarchaeaceae archaeon]
SALTPAEPAISTRRSATSMLAFFVFCIFIILQIQFREPAVLSFRTMLALIRAQDISLREVWNGIGNDLEVHNETL